jgi:hypothetical protein
MLGVGMGLPFVVPKMINARTFSPADVAGRLLWLDAQFTSDVSVNAVPNPDTVSAWISHDGPSAADVAEATNQPEWQPTGWNGTQPTLRFNSASSQKIGRGDTAALATALSNNAAFTWYYVADFSTRLTNAEVDFSVVATTWAPNVLWPRPALI